MTTLTMRMIKGDFVVTGPDIEPMKYKSRREARDCCAKQHPGSPIEEIGPAASGQRAGGQNRRGATPGEANGARSAGSRAGGAKGAGRFSQSVR